MNLSNCSCARSFSKSDTWLYGRSSENCEITSLQFPCPPKSTCVCLALIKSKHFEIVLSGALFASANKSVRHSFNLELEANCLNKTEQIKTDTTFRDWILILFRAIMSNVIDFKCLNQTLNVLKIQVNNFLCKQRVSAFKTEAILAVSHFPLAHGQEREDLTEETRQVVHIIFLLYFSNWNIKSSAKTIFQCPFYVTRGPFSYISSLSSNYLGQRDRWF